MSAHGTPLLDLVLARKASREAGFGYDADLAAVIAALRARVSELETRILELKAQQKTAIAQPNHTQPIDMS